MQLTKSRWLRIVIALSIVFFLGQTAFAQFGASLQGTVEDTSGSVVPGANVTITNVNTQQTQSQTTGDSGYYRFSELPPGAYNIDITAPSFKKASFSAVNLVAETPRNIDAKLAAGATAETVTVTADQVPALQNADASVGTTIDSQQLERVPTFGRDPYELLRTAPGISGDGARSGSGQAVFLPNAVGPGGSNQGIAQTENQVQITANGQSVADNNYLIDGVSVNSLGRGGAAVVTPNIEAVGSIGVISTSFSAEDGRNTGAQIKTVTKTGTNKFHGGATFTYDEPGLNAFNKFGGPNGEPRTRVSNKNRDFAGSLGGPIFKDKAFFFLSGEEFHGANRTFASQFVETPQLRALIHSARPGNIADQIANAPGSAPRINALLTQSCTTPVDFGTTPCAVVAGGLDIGSPVGSQGTYASFNIPNQIAAGGGLDGVPDVQFVQLIEPSHTRARQYVGRFDFNVTPADQLAFSAYITKLDAYSQSGADGSRPNADVPFKPLNTAGTFIYIHTFNASLLNEFRANVTRFSENGIKDGGSLVNFGVPYINIQNQQFDGPVGDLQFGVKAGNTTPAIFAENQYELRDTVTKTFGAHTLKVGFEGRLEQDNNNLLGNIRPTFAFAGLWNFVNDAPIFESINVDPDTGGPGNSARYLHDHYYAGFVQHDWKLRSNFTLNTGVRYEYFEPLYNKGSNLNLPTFGGAGRELIDITLSPRHYLWDPQYNNVSPKVGFAWTPYADGKTVVRGGFGRAYNRLPDSLFDNTIQDGPGFFSYNICCGTAPQDFGTPFVGGQIQYELGATHNPNSFAPNKLLITKSVNGLPANGQGIQVYGVQRNLSTPYSYLYSMEVQREFPQSVVLTLGYQGSNGRHYTRLVNQLFLFPNSVTVNGKSVGTQFNGGAFIAQSDSNQYYNALNVHVVKRFAHGYSLDGTYTWSKSIDQISNGDSANASANQTDPAHNRTERGPSDYDLRNRVVVIGTYDFPKYHGDRQFVKPLVNGWQLNGNFTAHTGFPFTPVTNLINGVPSVVNASVIGPVRPYGFIGTNSPTCSNSAFIAGSEVQAAQFVTAQNPSGQPQLTTPGIGRNSFRGPCYQSVDLSAAKEFALPFLGEQSFLRLQANAFNLFNHLNLTPFTNGNGNGASLIESSTFGRAQSAGAGRVVEFVARFRF